MAYFLCQDWDSDSDSDSDSCTMQDFSTGSDSDPDLLIEMYVIGICPWCGDLSLKRVQQPFGKGIQIQVQICVIETCFA